MKPVFAAFLLTTAALAGTPTDDYVLPDAKVAVPAAAKNALAGIKAESIDAHVHFLASPTLEGRGLGTRGLDAATEYAAAQLARAGIEPLLPATDGASRWSRYFQSVPVRALRDFSVELAVEIRRGDEVYRRTFVPGVDAVVTGCAPQERQVSAYFAGSATTLGPEVRGKAVLVLRGRNDGDPEDRWNKVLDSARAQGAALVLALDGIDTPKELADAEFPSTFFLPLDDPHPRPPFARLGAAAARPLFEAAGVDPATASKAAPHEVAGVTVTLHATAHESVIVARNVLGVIRGKDDKAVVAGAHLDHLGRIGDRVHPGADDNASGVSALIEIARGFAESHSMPMHTLVVAFWAGEEEGKFGSGWYVSHPVVPLERTLAYVNFDMIGHTLSLDEIRKLPGGEAVVSKVKPETFAEPGLPVDAPQIADALTWAAHASGMALHLDRCDGTHGGSDYRDFARAKVPWVRFFGNFFPEYHKPGDTADALDAGQVARMARLGFGTIWILAGF